MLSQFDLAFQICTVMFLHIVAKPILVQLSLTLFMVKPLAKEDIKNKYMIHLIINPNTHRYIYTSKMNAQPHKGRLLLVGK